MARTNIVTGLAASVGTIAIAAALGFAQPDGLEPPAGPVVDTQPSLTEIRDLILASGDDVAIAEQRKVFQNSNFSGSINIPVGRVLVDRLTVFRGSLTVTDSSGQTLAFDGGVENISGSVPFRVEPFEHELGIVLDGPLTVVETDGSTTGGITLIYRELP